MTQYAANKVRSEYSRSVYYVTQLLGLINDSIKNYFVLSEKNRVLMCGVLILAVILKDGIDRYFDAAETETESTED